MSTDTGTRESMMPTDEFMGEYKEFPTNRIPNVKVGDQVTMTSKYPVSNEHKGVIWTVTEGPVFIKGKRYVRLEGFCENYPIDGLKIVG